MFEGSLGSDLDALASQLYLREAQALDPGNASIKTALQSVSP